MLRRWLSWFDAFADADKTYHSRLLALITFGMSNGIYKDLTEVPLWKMEGEDGGAVFEGGEDSDDEAARADAAAGEGDVEGRPVIPKAALRLPRNLVLLGREQHVTTKRWHATPNNTCVLPRTCLLVIAKSYEMFFVF